MWGSGAIPVGTYTSAIITLDYTNAAIYVLVNGQPQKATVVDYATEAVPTTYAITVTSIPRIHPIDHTDLRIDERHALRHRLRSGRLGHGGPRDRSCRSFMSGRS